jgi:hypothetical protein
MEGKLELSLVPVRKSLSLAILDRCPFRKAGKTAREKAYQNKGMPPVPVHPVCANKPLESYRMLDTAKQTLTRVINAYIRTESND